MNDPDDIITRCPSCQTSFRITGEQLKVAAGAVRCGACLRIFQADDEIIQVPKLPGVTEILPGLQGSAPTPPLQFAMSEKEAESAEATTTDHLTLGEEGLESSIESRCENIHDTTDVPCQVPLDGFDGSAADETIVRQFWSHWNQYVENSFVEEIPGQNDEVLAPDLSSTNLSHQQPQHQASTDSHDIGQCIHEETGNTAEASDARLDDDLDALVGHLNLENDRAELIESELREVPTLRGWETAVTSLIVVILLLTGLAQYAWFNKNLYAQDVRMRPYFLTVCHWVNCVLPDYVNDDDLVAQNLVVRPHNSVEGALTVDAILRNSAIFRQQFPLLELQFEDINGRVVAMRRFSPQEYLAGELRGLRFIPANTEVRFSLQILRPGEEALGFSLKVVHRSW